LSKVEGQTTPNNNPTRTQGQIYPWSNGSMRKKIYQRIQILTVECYEEYNTLAQGEV